MESTEDKIQGLDKRIKEYAEKWAFMFYEMDIKY